jgi:Helix-turn-helix.
MEVIMDVEINRIGILIRNERILKGMTQEELGEKVGVGKAQISKIESGKGLTIKTVTKVLDALNMVVTVRLIRSDNINKRMVGYIVAVIGEFAKTYNMTIKDASNYLNSYKGLEFLIDNYEAEHLLSLYDSVQDLSRVCYNNGGGVL